MSPLEPKCEFCGKTVDNGYIQRDHMHWCSQRHYLAWVSEQQTWDDESMPFWHTEPIE